MAMPESHPPGNRAELAPDTLPALLRARLDAAAAAARAAAEAAEAREAARAGEVKGLRAKLAQAAAAGRALAEERAALEVAAAALGAGVADRDRRLDELGAAAAAARAAAGRSAAAGDALRSRLAAAEASHRALAERLGQREAELTRLGAALAEANAAVGRLTAEVQGLRDYAGLVPRVRAEATRLLPPGARVAVVSKGDDALLALDGGAGRHFPPGEGGGYSGYHPADSAEAIRHVESLRREGVQFLLFPATAYWWLDHYKEFAAHLDTECSRVWRTEACQIYHLARPDWRAPDRDRAAPAGAVGSPSGNGATARPPAPARSPRMDPGAYRALVGRVKALAQSVVPDGGVAVVVSKGDEELVRLGGRVGWHFPRGEGGGYAGHYPADSGEAVRHLEALRSEGGQYFLIPVTALWWLDHYPGLRDYLEQSGECVVRNDDAAIYRLNGRAGPDARQRQGAPDASSAAAAAPPERGPAPPADPYAAWAAKNDLIRYTPERAGAKIARFARRPTVSIVMPVFNTPEEYLRKAIESVLAQYYPDWELCVCDDASTAGHVRAVLREYARRDKRIKVTYSRKNGRIARASNRAASLATGEFLGLLDHDDELTPDALYEVVSCLQEVDADVLYSDEDKLDPHGNRCQPFFKPAWCPDLLLSCMYTCHFTVYRRSLVEAVGGFREGYDGSQDWDLALRVTEKARNVVHVPRILYHWRMIPSSVAASSHAKPYAHEAGRRAIQDAMTRRGEPADVFPDRTLGFNRVRRQVRKFGTVSVIIPTRDRADFLRRCLISIEMWTRYPDYEILIIDNGSTEPAAVEYLRTLPHRVIRDDGPFNFSRLNNRAAAEARGEYLLFLNNDTEVMEGDWMTAMVEHAQRPEVGAVGAKLLYPDGRIQHAGVVMGLAGPASHGHLGLDGYHGTGYFNFPNVIRDYSAVTAACLMMRRSVFQEVGGFNETNLRVAYNDVDLCLRVRERGYLVAYTPYARLYHYESASRGRGIDPREVEYLTRRWGRVIADDPYYNPSLGRSAPDFSVDLSKPEAFACAASQNLTEAVVGPLAGGRVIEQQFAVPEDRLCGVAVTFGTYHRRAKGTVRFRLRAAASGRVEAAVEVDAAQLEDNAPFVFQFEPLRASADRTFRLSVEFEPASGSLLTLYKSSQTVHPAGPHLENGRPGQGTVTFQAYCLARYRCFEAGGPRRNPPGPEPAGAAGPRGDGGTAAARG